jgi:hypothetical protein
MYIIHQIRCLRNDLHELLDNIGYIENRMALNYSVTEAVLNILIGNPNTKTEKKNPEKHISYCCGNCKYFYRKADGSLVINYCQKGVNDVCPYDICDWYESYI